MKFQKKIFDATAFTNIKIKVYYNVQHTSLLLNTNNHAYFQLHHDYQLLKQLN